MKSRSVLLSMALFLFIVSPAHAEFYLDDIDFWTGTGSNRAAMVIHWSSPEVFNKTSMQAPSEELSFAWGYRFDGAATGADMMTAIAAADPRLYVLAGGDPNMGAAILGIGYDRDGDGVFGLSDGTTTYTAADFNNGFMGDQPYAAGDAFLPTDDGDVYWGGWYGPNWELWHEQGGAGLYEKAPERGGDEFWSGNFFAGSHGEWDFSGLGVSGISLENGSWVGWSVAAGGLEMENMSGPGSTAWKDHKQAPADPVAAAAVPVPAAVWLLGSGLLGLMGIRRIRK